MSALRPFPNDKSLQQVPAVGINTGHELYLKEYSKAKKLNKLLKIMNRQEMKKEKLITSPKTIFPVSQSAWLE